MAPGKRRKTTHISGSGGEPSSKGRISSPPKKKSRLKVRFTPSSEDEVQTPEKAQSEAEVEPLEAEESHMEEESLVAEEHEEGLEVEESPQVEEGRADKKLDGPSINVRNQLHIPPENSCGATRPWYKFDVVDPSPKYRRKGKKTRSGKKTGRGSPEDDVGDLSDHPGDDKELVQWTDDDYV